MLLNAKQILDARDRKTVEVEVPEWGDGARVLVGVMGVLDWADIQDYIDTLGRAPAPAEPDPGAQPEACDDEPQKKPEPEKTYSMVENVQVMLRWCVACILDPMTFQRAFTLDQLMALGAKSQAALKRIYDAALGLHHESQEARKAFEKNSGGTPSGSSGGD